MLGPAKPRRLDQPIAVSLEDLVPADHFYRHLETTMTGWSRRRSLDGPSIGVLRSAEHSSEDMKVSRRLRQSADSRPVAVFWLRI